VLNAVIDSALAYEALKPIVRELRIISALQDEENKKLREQVRLTEIRAELATKQAKAEREKAEADRVLLERKRRRAFWRGLGWGVGGAFLLSTITH